MKHTATLCVSLALLLTGAEAQAATPATITDPAAPLVKQLELRYTRFLAAARAGDLDAYWAYRTTAARSRPPTLNQARLKLLADLLPRLETLQFVRLDRTEKTARALYRWRGQEVVQYTAIVFRVEQDDWKIDAFGVKRSGTTTSARTRMEALTRQREEVPPGPALALEGPRL